MTTTCLSAERHHAAVAEILAGRAERPVRQTVDMLASAMNNRDTYSAELAERADAQGRPAYWTVGLYSQAAWCTFADFANQRGIDEALALCVDETWPHGLKSRATLIATLLPLNIAATLQLAVLAWRDEREAAGTKVA